MFGSITEQSKAESDRHDGCGIRGIEPADTSTSTKQFHRYLLRSYCLMRFHKLTSLSTKHDVQLLNNMAANCLRRRQLHIRRTVRGQMETA
jgi:hypothetical protein